MASILQYLMQRADASKRSLKDAIKNPIEHSAANIENILADYQKDPLSVVGPHIPGILGVLKQNVSKADPQLVAKINEGINKGANGHKVFYDPDKTAYVTMTRDQYLNTISKEMSDNLGDEFEETFGKKIGESIDPKDVTSYEMGYSGIAHRVGPNGEFIDFEDGLKPGMYAADDERFYDEGGFTKTIYNLLP